MFSLETKVFDHGQEQIDYLKRADEKLGAAIARIGMVERTVMTDPFTALIHAVVGQLISVKAAQTVFERLEQLAGGIVPERIVRLSPEDIRGCGMSMKKAHYISNIARAVEEGALDFDELRKLPDREAIRKLTALEGIGVWTAEMLLIHSLERQDVVSWGDLAIRRGMMRLYGLDSISKRQFDAYRQTYSPFGTIASIYLWELSHEET